MSEIKDIQVSKFDFRGFEVRTGIDKDGNIWFVASDVCTVLDLSNVTMALSALPENDLGNLSLLDVTQRHRNIRVISEAGLYKLIFKSHKETALEFQNWVTHDVLISIRKHGAYIEKDIIDQWIDDPDYGIRLLSALKKEREAKKQAEKKVEHLETQLGFTTEYASIKRVSIALGKKEKDYDWRLLRKESIAQGKAMPKVDDANYDTVNTYHAAVWAKVYGINLSDLKEGK